MQSIQLFSPGGENKTFWFGGAEKETKMSHSKILIGATVTDRHVRGGILTVAG